MGKTAILRPISFGCRWEVQLYASLLKWKKNGDSPLVTCRCGGGPLPPFNNRPCGVLSSDSDGLLEFWTISPREVIAAHLYRGSRRLSEQDSFGCVTATKMSEFAPNPRACPPLIYFIIRILSNTTQWSDNGNLKSHAPKWLLARRGAGIRPKQFCSSKDQRSSLICTNFDVKVTCSNSFKQIFSSSYLK